MQFFKNSIFKQPFVTWENYRDAMLNEKASDKTYNNTQSYIHICVTCIHTHMYIFPIPLYAKEKDQKENQPSTVNGYVVLYTSLNFLIS